MPLKLCLVGCGSFAELCHGPVQQACAARGEVVLAGCCDAAAARAEAYRRSFGFARAYADAPAMLAAERPDAIVLAVPPAVTAQAAPPLLAAGVPVLMEKPPGLNLAELSGLIAAAQAGGTRVQVAFNRRYMPVIVKAKAQLARWGAGAISRIDYAMVRHARWDEDFSTTAIHAVDALLHLAGAPLAAAELHCQPQQDGARRAVNVELRGETKDGARVTLTIAPVAGSNRESAAVYGIGREMHLRIPASPLANDPGTLSVWIGGKETARYSDDSATMVERMGIQGEYDTFLARIRSGGPFTPALEDARPAVTLMSAIREARPGPVTDLIVP